MELYLRYPGFKTKAVTLSYDDGSVSDRKMVTILNQHHIKCTFNLNSGLMDKASNIHKEEAPVLYDNSFYEIAVHTLNHPHLSNLGTAQIAYEILEDRKNLEDIFSHPIEGMAYPYGLDEIESEIETIANCGIRYARTALATRGFELPKDFLRLNPTCHHDDPELFQLLDRFLQPDDIAHPWRTRLKLFFLWGHSYEFDQKKSWDKLENICCKIGGRGEIWYATNGEIIDYIDAYNHLRRNVNGNIIHNPSDCCLFAMVNGQNVILEPGKTIDVLCEIDQRNFLS